MSTMKVEHYRTVSDDYVTVRSSPHWTHLLVEVRDGNRRQTQSVDAVMVVTEELAGTTQYRLRGFTNGKPCFQTTYLLDGPEPWKIQGVPASQTVYV